MLNKKPLASIVMPTYNRLEWIGESISSALCQTVKEIEVIVVDDASDDGTKEFLEDWGKKMDNLKVITNPTNLGAGKSRNIGMEAAQSDIIIVADSDDLNADERVALTLKHFELNPESELVTFPYISIGYNNEKLEEFEGMTFDHDLFLKTGGITYFCNPSCAYRKKSAMEIGGYEPENDKETDDVQFLRKWVKAGKKVDFQPGYFVTFHRVLPNSMMVKSRGWKPEWVGAK